MSNQSALYETLKFAFARTRAVRAAAPTCLNGLNSCVESSRGQHHLDAMHRERNIVLTQVQNYDHLLGHNPHYQRAFELMSELESEGAVGDAFGEDVQWSPKLKALAEQLLMQEAGVQAQLAIVWQMHQDSVHHYSSYRDS